MPTSRCSTVGAAGSPNPGRLFWSRTPCSAVLACPSWGRCRASAVRATLCRCATSLLSCRVRSPRFLGCSPAVASVLIGRSNPPDDPLGQTVWRSSSSRYLSRGELAKAGGHDVDAAAEPRIGSSPLAASRVRRRCAADAEELGRRGGTANRSGSSSNTRLSNSFHHLSPSGSVVHAPQKPDPFGCPPYPRCHVISSGLNNTVISRETYSGALCFGPMRFGLTMLMLAVTSALPDFDGTFARSALIGLCATAPTARDPDARSVAGVLAGARIAAWALVDNCIAVDPSPE